MPSPRSSEVLVAFGLAVRARRKARGFSQEQLAEASGLHPRYVSDVERGQRNIGMRNVDRLAQALAIDLQTLFADVEANRSR